VHLGTQGIKLHPAKVRPATLTHFSPMLYCRQRRAIAQEHPLMHSPAGCTFAVFQPDSAVVHLGTQGIKLAQLFKRLPLQHPSTHQWGALWPQPVHARMEILSSLSQRLQQRMRTLLQHPSHAIKLLLRQIKRVEIAVAERKRAHPLLQALGYTLTRTQLAGLAGLNEGLAILEALITHQWGALWPQPGLSACRCSTPPMRLSCCSAR
jgi:hypothetical protein